jgi:hypothetical protein
MADLKVKDAAPETAPETVNVKVYAKYHRQRHPVTGQVFSVGQPVDVIDLEHPDNVFVKHQLDAGVFAIVE